MQFGKVFINYQTDTLFGFSYITRIKFNCSLKTSSLKRRLSSLFSVVVVKFVENLFNRKIKSERLCDVNTNDVFGEQHKYVHCSLTVLTKHGNLDTKTESNTELKFKF